MTTLKSFTLFNHVIEQVYYGSQDIRYRFNGEELSHDDFWKSTIVRTNYNQVIKKLNYA